VSNVGSLIADNLVSVLNGGSIQIGTEVTPRTILSERQRLIFNSQGSAFYVEVCGPWPETMETSGDEKHVGLHFIIEAHLSGINDRPPALPITVQAENAGGDLAALIMADITRGGNALLTRIDGLPYYAIIGDFSAPEFIIRLDIIVEVFSLITE
jgi:hypothetical protein